MTVREALGQGEFIVDALNGEQRICERLYEMGVYPGVMLQVLQKLPFGGPYIVTSGGSTMALRETEASCLTLNKTSQ